MNSRLPLRIVAGLLACLAAFTTACALSYEQRQNLVYAEVHGTGLLMDVFVPKEKTNGLAIVDVVSGAWYSDRNKIRDHTLAGMYEIHCAKGYTVFAIRPGSKTRYTALEMDQHIKTGIRYVKSHASEYSIDPERLGMTGASAGGHLATLAALTPADAKPDAKNPLERFSTRVRAVGVFFPPTDFLNWKEGQPGDPKILVPLLFVGGGAGKTDAEILEQARLSSPFHRVTQPEPPFLLIHGDADPVVPIEHSRKLVKAIADAGGKSELIVKKGGGHPWLTMMEEVKILADWFDRQLAGPESEPAVKPKP
jgi:acetyl esterase/lipase